MNLKWNKNIRFNSTLLLSSIEHIHYFPWRSVCFCSLFLACVFFLIVNAIMMNELTTEIYHIHRTGITGKTDRQKGRQTDTHTHTHTHVEIETDTLPIYHIGSSKNNENPIKLHVYSYWGVKALHTTYLVNRTCTLHAMYTREKNYLLKLFI